MYALWYLVIGSVVAAAEGYLLAITLKTGKRSIWKDAPLGACGMIGGFLLVALIPFPTNTITYRLGETVVTETANWYQHPLYVAFALALSLPLFRAMMRHRKQSASLQANENRDTAG